MIDRYHLPLAALALGVGALVVVLDRSGRPGAARRSVAVATLAGAAVGSWGIPRGLPWVLVAAALVLVDDTGERPGAAPTALGRWAAPLALTSYVGVWSAVPDTEPALAGACVLAPVALSRWQRDAPVGIVGTAALATGVLGAAWTGSAGWGTALATSCAVGMVVVAPMAIGPVRRELAVGEVAALCLAHVVVAVVVPRSIMRRTLPVAVLVALGALAALVAVALLVGRRASARARPASHAE